jgi:hypothetical protein
VNEGEITLQEAIEDANAPENIVASCGGVGGCNQIKGARMPASEPGKNVWVPPNPVPEVQARIRALETTADSTE